jgi:hypothetical protein
MFARSKKAMDSSPAHVRPRPPDAPPPEKLPLGAEAALLAIVEVIPDPRNHLALTRDPTCEVRLTPAQLAEALATAPRPSPAPALVRQQPRRADVRWSTDTAEVRLPAIASPDAPAAGNSSSVAPEPVPGDASIHPLDPPARHADRWAKGA